MNINDADKRAIDEAVEKLHYVHKGEHGKYIQIYADYRDSNEALLGTAYDNRRIAFDSKEDAKDALVFLLRDAIDEWYVDARWQMEDEIMTEAGFDASDERREELLDYLRDTYPIIPDFDHFLDQKTHINIMLECGDESNRDFVAIHEQFDAMFDADLTPAERKDALAVDTGLSWLVKQQGHTMEELLETAHAYLSYFDSPEAEGKNYTEKYDAFSAKHNPFLSSVCQELVNMVNYMNTMTVLTNISLSELGDFMQPGKEIVLPKNSMIGIFNPWNGGGSMMDITLEKDLVVPSKFVYDIQIEGAKPAYQYTVDNVYGLVGSCWQDAKEIREGQLETPAVENKKPSLSSLIDSASQRAGGNVEQKGQIKTAERNEQGRV